MLRKYSLLALGVAALALVTIAGCQQASDNVPETTNDAAEVKAPAPARSGEHGHKPGEHGGNIVEIGRDNYHAEVVFEKEGVVRLYLLGKDEARVLEVEAQVLTGHARPEGGREALPFEIKPTPSKEDAPGKASQFAGTLPPALWDRPVEVTVPSIRIGGDRYRFFFKSTAKAAHTAMPPAVPSAKARQLYLTPKGKYTAADIKANGNQTARQKYGDEMSEHDAHPQKGDRVCPISKTKASPKFTWVVGGKAYAVCCTPCIDELVKWAKEAPEKVQGPEAYVQP